MSSASEPHPNLRSLHEVALNAISEMVSVVGEDGVYRMVNDAWCKGYALQRERALGRTVAELFPDGYDRQRLVEVMECLHTNQPRTRRGVFQVKPLVGRHYEATFSPFGRDSQGVRCVVVVTRDVTTETEAMQRSADAEATTRELLDAFPGLIGVMDDNMVYSFANPLFLELLGRPEAQVVGRPVAEVLGQQRASELAEILKAVGPQRPLVYERQQRGSRTIQYTVATGVNRKTGRPQFYGFGTDISAHKATERAHIEARAEAERANQAKSLFLSHMSHELRTPLNAILGFAQLLDDELRQPGLTEQRAMVGKIQQGGQHLLRLISEVLDLQRIEAGKLELTLKPVPLLELVQDCFKLMEPLARARPVQLLALPLRALDRVVQADDVRLKQVLLNLLGNAIKYNREGGVVAITCEDRGPQLRISVRDTGLGLQPEHIERLFTPFERIATQEQAVEGTGIGLALSRRLMQAMGGDVGVSSEPDVGSVFWVELQRARQRSARPGAHTSGDTGFEDSRPAEPPARTSVAIGNGRHVLYIEDNAVNIVLMEAMLARLPGLTLSSEMTPEAGLQLAADVVPDLILLDIQLPGLSGYDVLQRLRASARTRSIPVIAVSANAMPSDVAQGLAAGFADYITKPIELSRLLAVVSAALTPNASTTATSS
jgi:PAS domain S-box-containing protein